MTTKPATDEDTEMNYTNQQGQRDRHKQQSPGKINFMKLVELIRIRKESNISSWANQPSSWVNWGKRKEQRMLESTSKRAQKAK